MFPRQTNSTETSVILLVTRWLSVRCLVAVATSSLANKLPPVNEPSANRRLPSARPKSHSSLTGYLLAICLSSFQAQDDDPARCQVGI